MSTLIVDTILSHLPLKRKQTPSGWISFNAPCCVHNGDNADTRQRGGLIVNNEDGISYHCFNCGYKASWLPGRGINRKLKNLMKWLNVSDELINQCSLEALRIEQGVHSNKPNPLAIPKFTKRPLPLNSRPLLEWIDTEHQSGVEQMITYLFDRGLDVYDYDFYWTPEKSYRSRLIIPFRINNETVGWTARTINAASPKYLSDQEPGFVFNLDAQNNYDRKFVIVTEGVLDAVSVQGVALLGNELKTGQSALINRLQKEVIVVPDKDAAGKKLVHEAIQQQWSVSMPDWPDGIKDINDCVKNFGKIYTLLSITQAKESNSLKIQLRAKNWFPKESR